MKIIFCFVVLARMGVLIFGEVNNEEVLKFLSHFFHPLLILATIIQFLQVHHLMKKLHKYEYEKVRKSMKVFFAVTLLGEFFNIFRYGAPLSYFGLS